MRSEVSTALRCESRKLSVSVATILGMSLLPAVIGAALEFQEESMNANRNNGVVTIRSHGSLDATVANLEEIPKAKGIQLFALVDNSSEAEKVGMEMRTTRLLIFGGPKAGTPLMFVAASVALDLPLKILVAEDARGRVWISYNSPEYLETRHHLPPEFRKNIAGIEAWARAAAK